MRKQAILQKSQTTNLDLNLCIKERTDSVSDLNERLAAIEWQNRRLRIAVTVIGCGLFVTLAAAATSKPVEIWESIRRGGLNWSMGKAIRWQSSKTTTVGENSRP